MEKEKEWICLESGPHYNKINEIKQRKIKKEDFSALSNMFKLFADETRLHIICCLLKEELCVCDLCELLGMNQSTVSHQLQLLRGSKLVKYRREGKQIFYTLQDKHVESLIQIAMEHIKEEEKK